MAAENEQNTPEVIEDDPREVRLAKREALIAAGEEPYGRNYPVDAHVVDLESEYADLEAGADVDRTVHVAGRIMAIRDQGKVCFIVLRDATGDIQLFCRINVLGEEAYAAVKDLDVGDWVGAEGTIMRTRRGQLSVSPVKVSLLSKSIRPLPEKFHGLADKEIRYRQRYVDLVMNPEVKGVFEKRFKIIAAVRAYCTSQGFLEVETPMLHAIRGGATARPFVTHHNALDRDFYLRIAPELYLKRLLVGGFERVFEINRSFRNEGMDHSHNPEFTMMEAYQAYGDMYSMMDFTEGVIRAAVAAVCESPVITYQGQTIDLGKPFARRSMIDLVSEKCGEDVSFNRTVEEVRAICDKFDVHYEADHGIGKMIQSLYDELVEDTITEPTFVFGHPTEVSPLAKRNAENPDVTDRFELFILGKEYANAFSELNDPVDQKGRFLAQVASREAGDDEAMDYDTDYIRALEYGMPPAGGMGIGIDRLAMLLTDSESIRDVLLFPTMRPEKNTGTAPASAGDDEAVEGAETAVASEEIDFSKVEIEPLFEDLVDFETFSKSDFRAVKVLACEAVPKSKKLLKFTLDDGSGEERIILSGIHAYYEPEELVGKTCIAITNLPPRAMMGIESCGMLISAVHQEEGEEKLHLLMVDPHIPAGAKMY